jgi:hypothetical protein
VAKSTLNVLFYSPVAGTWIQFWGATGVTNPDVTNRCYEPMPRTDDFKDIIFYCIFRNEGEIVLEPTLSRSRPTEEWFQLQQPSEPAER